VMSARPGRISGIVQNELPYPRTAHTREEPRFFEVVTEVRERLAAGHARVDEAAQAEEELLIVDEESG
jgi:NitT/TauT family transport system ATP-binding protein